MCIIVDINTLPAVFVATNSEHAQFKAVFDAIDNGIAPMTIGGTKYKNELAQMKSFTRYFAELGRAKKLVRANDQDVDALEAKIEADYSDPAFNDKHIVALTYSTRGKLVCTKDKVLQHYITTRGTYSRVRDVPKLAKVYNESSRSSMVGAALFRTACLLCN